MLSREQLEDAKTCPQHGCHNCKMFKVVSDFCQTELAESALELLDKTEAQQKEIEKLTNEIIAGEDNWSDLTSKLDCANIEVKSLEQKNKQLKAQNAAMREVLQPYKSSIGSGSYAMVCPICKVLLNKEETNHSEYCKAKGILSAEPIEYHNPADVEEIRVLREQLPEHECKPSDDSTDCYELAVYKRLGLTSQKATATVETLQKAKDIMQKSLEYLSYKVEWSRVYLEDCLEDMIFELDKVIGGGQ